MNLNSLSFIFVSFACFHLNRFIRADGEDIGEPHACMEKLSVEDKKTGQAIMETCKKKLNLDKIPKMDEVEKNGFDDKCFAKCKLTAVKILNDKGVVDKTAIEEFAKKVIPAKQADVMSLWQECSDSTMKTMEKEGGINEANSCKAAAMMKHCFMKGITKFC